MPPISACVITLNEEDNIGRILDSLIYFTEIIVLDSGSTDKTLNIAGNYKNVKIFTRKFDNYINQKNHCISLSSNDWVLSLDADECITDQLFFSLKSLPESSWETYVGIEFPRLSFYMGKWIYHGGWYPNYQLRVFNKNFGKFVGLYVHEKVQVNGSVLRINVPFHHYSYRNISDHLKFIDTYSSLTAKEKFTKGKKSGVIFAILEGIYKFFQMYFIKFGFLDGRVGLIIAVLGAYYNFLKYIKLYEYNLKNKNISL